jgi:uncharacterized protein (TIGR02246 family)
MSPHVRTQNAELISLYENLIKTWNDQDASGMATLYATQGGQVGFDGSQISGPGEIESHLAPIFRDHPTQKFVYIIREVRLLGDEVGLVRAVAGMVPRNDTKLDPSKNVVQTTLARKQKGKWMVELFQNTPAKFDGRPKEVEAMTKELQSVVEAQALSPRRAS